MFYKYYTGDSGRQFPEKIIGLNYDKHDARSLILMVVEEDDLIGSFRIVLDSGLGIPSEEMAIDWSVVIFNMLSPY